MTMYFESFTNLSQDIIVEELCQAILEERKVALILPTRQLIKEYRKKILKKLPAILSLNIMTFDDLIETRIKYSRIEENLLRQILVRKSIQICFQDSLLNENSMHASEGFVVLVNQYISDVKSSLLSHADLDFDSKLLNDFNHVLTTYNNLLKQHELEDRYDQYNSSLDHLNKYDHIYVDGFYEFRPIELRILKHLKENDINTSIYFHQLPGKDTPFFNSRIKELETFGFEKKYLDKKEISSFQKLSRTMRSNEKILNGECKLKLIRASHDPFLELHRLIIEIKEDQGIGYENMAVIVEDEEYLALLIKLFNYYNIPSNKRQILSLCHIDDFKWFTTLLSAKNTREFYLKYFQLLPLKNEDLTSNQKLGLEELIIYLERLFFQNLEELYTYDDFSTLIQEYDLIDLLGKAKNELENFKDNSYLIAKVLQVFNQLEGSFEGENLDFILQAKEFFTDIKQLEDLISLSNSSFRQWMTYAITSFELVKKQNGISILNSLEGRGLNFENIYILGFYESNFPKLRKYDSYYKRNNILELKSKGIQIFDQEELSEISYFRFLDVLASVSNKLYLSYTELEDSIVSNYMEKLEQLSVVENEEYNIKDYLDPKLIVSDRELQRKKIGLGENISQINLEKFQNKKKPIELDESQVLLLKNKNCFSISEINLMHQCSRKYYYEKVLRIETRERADQQLLGMACHQVLEDFYQYESNNIRNYLDDTRPDWRPSKAFISKHLEQILTGEFINNILSMYVERYTELIYRAILVDLTYLKSGGELFYPEEFEKEINIAFYDYQLKGRIDRLDRSKTGKIQLTDYKLGGSADQFSDIRKFKDIQLALYFLFNSSAIYSMKYLHLRDSTISHYFEHDELYSTKQAMKSDEISQLIEEIEKLVLTMIQSIQSGNFNEGPIDTRMCEYCPYAVFCDKKEESSWS